MRTHSLTFLETGLSRGKRGVELKSGLKWAGGLTLGCPVGTYKYRRGPWKWGSLRCAHSSLNKSVCQEWVFTMHGRTLALLRTSRVSLISLSLEGLCERSSEEACRDVNTAETLWAQGGLDTDTRARPDSTVWLKFILHPKPVCVHTNSLWKGFYLASLMLNPSQKKVLRHFIRLPLTEICWLWFLIIKQSGFNF